MKIRKNRWKVAQKNEKEFWDSWIDDFKNRKEISRKYWQKNLVKLKNVIPLKKNWKILEVGGGACPFVNFIPNCKKYSLDPLNNYYLSNFGKTNNVKYIQGVGENIPFDDNSFDLVILTNALDHVSEPSEVLSEIKRVLKKDRFLYLSVNCYNNFATNYRKIMEKLCLGDPPHPHSFSVEEINIILKSFGFKIVLRDENYWGLSRYISKSRKKKERKSFIQRAKCSFKEKGLFPFLEVGFYKISKFAEGCSLFGEKRKNILFILKKFKNKNA